MFPSTDLYALAVTCVVLLTNKPTAELFASYTHSWRWQDQHQVSPSLAAVLNQMLQATPNIRYQSADQALAALTGETGRAIAQQLPLLGGDSLYNPKILEVGGTSALVLIVAVPWHILDQPQAPFAESSRQL